MKKSPLKRKTGLRKKSKEPISKIQRRIWEIVKQIVRKKYENVCYTCGATGLVGSNCQTGHVPWPKSVLGAFLRYDLRVLKIQCFNCNIRRGGMGAEAYKIMLNEIGPEKMAELENDRKKIVNAYTHYQSLVPLYEQELKNLLK